MSTVHSERERREVLIGYVFHLGCFPTSFSSDKISLCHSLFKIALVNLMRFFFERVSGKFQSMNFAISSRVAVIEFVLITQTCNRVTKHSRTRVHGESSRINRLLLDTRERWRTVSLA